MRRILASLFITALITGCAASPRNQKTPQTQIGQLNSCMLREIYNMKDSNRLNGDVWTTAQEILSDCMHSLRLTEDDINHTQSINIAVSTIEAIR